MTDKLPPNLLALFTARPPLRWVPPCDTEPSQRKTPAITAVAPALAQAREVDEKYKHLEHPPTESWLEKRDRVKLEKEEKLLHLRTEGRNEFKPNDDPNVKGDPLRTLFVGRLSYETTEDDLRKAFGPFGRIQSVRIVENEHVAEDAPIKKKKRGYAFIVFADDQGMKDAYKRGDGIMVKGRPCLVDVERGRTVTGWIPRRFGGGLGGRGYTKVISGRPSGAPSGPGGFGRGGGYRGGYGSFRDRRGGGGFGGNRHDSRPGFGPSNGFGGPPDGAPSGPRGPRGPRQSSGPGGYGGGQGVGGGGGGGRFGDDRRPRNGPSGSNREPVGSRGGGGGSGGGGGGPPRSYQDRDRDGGYDDSSRKRRYDGDSYEDPRTKRRY